MKSLQNNLHTPPSGQSDLNHLLHPAHHRSPNNPETAWPEQCQDHRCLNDRHAEVTTTNRGRWALPETRAAMHEAHSRLAAARLDLGRHQVQLMGKQPAATMAIASPQLHPTPAAADHDAILGRRSGACAAS